MSYRDRNPATWTRGEVWDAYQDMMTRANNLATENVALAQRVARLEDVARAVAGMNPIIAGDDNSEGHLCAFHCDGHMTGNRDGLHYIHPPTCPYSQARTILAEPPIRARLDYGKEGGEG